MKKLSYGMVGGGPGSFIGDAHRKSINIDGKAVLTAGCFSRSIEKCRETGAQLGVAEDRCYVSFEEMAKAEAARPDGIDFVVVVTPNVSHYPVCKAFLEAGINVSCDKPKLTAAFLIIPPRIFLVRFLINACPHKIFSDYIKKSLIFQ